MQRIAVIDYGMGNLRSVTKAVEHVAPQDEVVLTCDSQMILSADRIVCPGQGAAADCMRALRENSLDKLIAQVIEDKPFLGICMGYQVLFERSDENEGVACLGYFKGRVRQFASPLIDSEDQSRQRLKVPHMGWSPVVHAAEHPLWHGIDPGARFYFAHSYFCEPDDRALVAGTCRYGHDFAAAVADRAVFASQFHPEKSAADGLQLLRNFVNWSGAV